MDRTVLCYGDSNTWGLDPATGGRFARDVRWPGVLAELLGDEWHVVEEGLNGRTTTLDSPVAPGKNGLTYLVPCLYSHAPLDVVVIYLGNNDLADRYSLPPVDIARAAAWLAVIVQRTPDCGVDGRAPRVILVCPPPLEPNVGFDAGFTGAVAKSKDLARWFREAAELVECDLVDLAGVTRYSAVDGIHLEAEGHRAVAAAVAQALAE